MYVAGFPGERFARQVAALAYLIGALDDESLLQVLGPIEGDGDLYGDYAFDIIDRMNASLESDAAWWGVYHGDLHFSVAQDWREVGRLEPSQVGRSTAR